MLKKIDVLAVLFFLVVLLLLLGSGCRFTEEVEVDEELVEQNEQVVLEDKGILVGQIDSQSVEIMIDGRTEAFALYEGVNVTEINDGSMVAFSYSDDEGRPVLLSIELIEKADPYLEGEGIYKGRSGSRSVEIEFDGQTKAFALDKEIVVDYIIEGSRVAFTYEDDEHRPLLLSISVIEKPVGGLEDELKDEGIFIGQIDANSVEIERKRTFFPGQGVNVEHIRDGSKVAFTFTETLQKAILDSIEAVDQPLEGEIMHGILIGQIDSQSVEIEYSQVFVLGQGVSVDDINEDAEITFSYHAGPYRPELTSVTAQ